MVSTAALGVAAYAGIALVWSRFFRPSRHKHAELKVQYFPFGKVATDLMPLLKHHRTDETKFFVIGLDGYSVGLDDTTYPWQKCVQDMANGAKEWTYFLQEPTPQASEALKRVMDLYPSKIKVLVLDSNITPTPADAETIQLMRTNHFLVSESPKMVWIEENHPPKSTDAYNCAFLPPMVAEHDDRHARLLNTFRHITSLYGKPLQ